MLNMDADIMSDFEIRTTDVIEYSYMEIESIKDILESNAREIGQKHSDLFESIGRGTTPSAFRSCTSWKAIEIIEQLQLAIEVLEKQKCQCVPY